MKAQAGLFLRRRLRLLSGSLASVVLGLSTGCAVGPAGAIAGRVTFVEGGWVLETYTIGAHIRTALADDPGFSLGAAKRSYLFAEEEAAKPHAGWYFFLLPIVSLDQALLRDLKVGGIDLHLGAPEAGLTVGFQRVTATRPTPMDGHSFHDLAFVPQSPVYACVSTRVERSC